MTNINKVIAVGNSTRQVELKQTPSGVSVATIGLALNRKFKDNSGNYRDEVCFIDAVCYSGLAEFLNKYCKKGDPVLIEGRLTYQQWTDRDGNKKSRHIITVENLQLLTAKSAESNSSTANNQEEPF
jgi:single-strand DNA-binding protein